MKSILAIALALAAAPAAYAQSVAVRYGDLDLSSAAGQTELERRIEAATRQACPAEAIVGTRIVDREAVESCRSEVRAQIAAKLPR